MQGCGPFIGRLTLACLALGAVSAHAGQASHSKQLIEAHCTKCHNTTDWAGGVAMDTLDVSQTSESPDIWEKTVNKLRGRLMPPAGEKQPSQADVDAMVAFLEGSLDGSAKSGAHPIAHVPLQRLNRVEFAESVRDLLGIDINARQDLPTEAEVDGFSNIAHALAVSPAFTEQYLSAVRRAARLAVGETSPRIAKVTIPATTSSAKDFPLGTRGGMPRGGIRFTHVFPADGEYHFNVPEEDFIDMGLYPRGAQTAATLVILVDGMEVVRKQIGGPEFLDLADRDGPVGRKAILDRVASSAQVKAGRHDVVMTYIERSRALSNDATVGNPFGGTGGGLGPGRVSDVPILQTAVEIEGPFAPRGVSLSDSRARIFVCQPAREADERPCAERIARGFATRAFRRPATDADVQRLMKLYDIGRKEPGGFNAGVTELVTAALSSPDFLYRALPTSATAREARPLTDLELASRLSFFLWSTGPDKELLDLAAAGRLSAPAVMRAQAARMLKDARASNLVENFALAWLNLDELDKVEPTDGGFNAAMRANFESEIRLFIGSVLLEDRSVVDLINADWTFLNESLARQYGIDGVRGPQFRRVTLKNPNRFGLLGKGAVLLRTSYGDRTSPVLRGAWILDKLIGAPPAPPPPNVNTDIGVKDGAPVTTVRARLELHRQSPSCKACHGIIDPPGLALENFDNTARWRDVDPAAKAKIDARTELTSGQVINGPVELRQHITSRPDQFPMTVARKLLMYALNRELEPADMPLVRQIVREAAADDYRFSALVNGVINSAVFRHQGPEPQDVPRQTVARHP
ncbi:MAG: hypothetical protein RLZZ200_916 [Pseudomonadota bacterium]